MKFSISNRNTILAAGFVATCITLGQSKTSNAQVFTSNDTNSVASNPAIKNDIAQDLNFEKPSQSYNPADCDIFEDARSIACSGPSDNVYKPKDRLDEYLIKAANYATKFVPLLNDNAQGGQYSRMILNDGKNYIVDAGYDFANTLVNGKIQKIPFFAQTSISIDSHSDGETNFSLDSLMKLKELGTDDEGDLKTLLFSQARFSIATNSDGSTTNLGLGLRHRPNDKSMIGGNVFWDYRMTDYADAHSRLGLGGEYLWNDFEFRNNWYMALTGTKNVTINNKIYEERVVPGWDVEAGYRFPNYPELAVFVRGFSWDYKDTDNNSGIEGSLNWQATSHINLEAWVSNEVSGAKTVHNKDLGTDDTVFGLRFKWTARPIKLKGKTTKQKIITQMTQPVRRNYEVLLERSGVGMQIGGG